MSKKRRIHENIKVIKNNLYVLRFVIQASPYRIVSNTIVVMFESMLKLFFGIFLLRYVINGIAEGISFQHMAIVLISFGGLQIIFNLAKSYYNEMYVPKSNQEIFKHIKKSVFAKAAEVELACFETPEFYDRYIKAVNESNDRAMQVLNSLAILFSSLVTLLTVSFFVFNIDIWLIFFSLIPFLASLIWGKKSNRLRYNYNMEYTEVNRKKNYVIRTFYLSDYAKEMRLSKISDVQFKLFYEAITGLIAVVRKYGFKIALIEYIFMISNDVFTFLGTVAYTTYQTLVTRTMLLGDCFVVINSINNIAGTIRQIIEVYLQFSDHSLYIENLKTFMDYVPQIDENQDGAHVAQNAPKRLSLREVTFTYPGQVLPTLKKISIDLEPGQKIAIVGHNGAGKSTLVKLLLRLYDPTSGQILLNGEDIRRLNLAEYRNLFGTVFQDFKVFALSIGQNVALTSEFDPIVVENALQSSDLYDKVSRLKDGLASTLTREFDEEGVVLSGGEAQKLAIARVFVKNNEIVIFDEPSSALDPVAEYKIYESMLQVCERKTVIFISHRLSSAKLADKIYFMEHGEVIEQGTHAELMAINGKYAEIFDIQAKYYLDKECC